jgi:hypothetical protein
VLGDYESVRQSNKLARHTATGTAQTWSKGRNTEIYPATISQYYTGNPECLAASFAHERLHAAIWDKGKTNRGIVWSAMFYGRDFAQRNWSEHRFPNDTAEEQFVKDAVDGVNGHGCFRCFISNPNVLDQNGAPVNNRFNISRGSHGISFD